MKIKIFAALIAAAGAANAQTVIYDTFNENDQANLFDCCNALTIRGTTAGHPKAAVQFWFTPQTTGRITEIDIPLSYTSGDPNEIEILFIGFPKGVKHTFRARNLPAPGQCCAFQALEAKGVPFQGGHQYRIMVEAKGRVDTLGGWNLNSAGIVGDYSITDSGNGKWRDVNDVMPAIRIIEQ